MSIHTYDLIMLGLLVLLTLRGLWKGLIHQMASLLSVFLSFWVATQYADRLAPYVGGTAPTNHWVAMLILYIATAFL
ncbi:MAG: CvpA family protein, partial [Planctomycetia bacterium]|nr:CvpA family protein [Planctomycetia bacterium]